jgi:hypothetical protein
MATLRIQQHCLPVGEVQQAFPLRRLQHPKAADHDDDSLQVGREGLTAASEADRTIWAEFMANPEAIADECEAAAINLSRPLAAGQGDGGEPDQEPLTAAPTATEVAQLVRARRVQSFFRTAVLTSYGSRCAITGLADSRVLNASHIIPWSVNERRRADPTNGLCLNALFDRGLNTFDAELRLLLAPALQETARQAPLECSLLESEVRLPGGSPVLRTAEAMLLGWA